MIKDIQYQGYAANPSDYECPDGQLAASINVIAEDQHLRPIFPPATLLKLPTNHKIIFIHHTPSAATHYIVKQTDDAQSDNHTLYWLNKGEDATSLTQARTIATIYGVRQIQAVGNTLIVISAKAINYILWKDNAYHILGNKLPEANISFSLVAHPRLWRISKEKNSDTPRGMFSITFDRIPADKIYDPFTDTNKTKITSQVMAKVNKFIAENTTEKGRFCFPFFIRWAYRLYDGSHVMHSAPILMTPSTTPAPIVFFHEITGKDGYFTEAKCDIMMVAADIEYKLEKRTETERETIAETFSRWQDIITAVDIYISKPIYTYDQGGEFTSFADTDNFDSKFIGRLYNGPKDQDKPDHISAGNTVDDLTEDRIIGQFTDTNFLERYMEYTYEHIYSMYFTPYRTLPVHTLNMPEFSDDKTAENIEATQNFYLLSSIDIKEFIPTEPTETDEGNTPAKIFSRKKIQIKEDYLQSLTSRETLTDDYLTHDRLIPTTAYTYNSRLNLSGVRRELFAGFSPNAVFPYCNDIYTLAVDNTKVTIKSALEFTSGIILYPSISLRVYIRENGTEYHVESSTGNYFDLSPLSHFVHNYGRWTSKQIINDGTTKTTEWDFEAGTKTVYDTAGNIISTEYNRYRPTAFGSFFFYPNAGAYRLEVYQNGAIVFATDLRAHEYLNGAYTFLGFKSERGKTTKAITPTNYDTIVYNPSKIFTSEVNNPFYFPLTGINTIGTGTIIGLSSANKALSQGQFGQFPLYAFTTDGVWALEVTSTGTYSARQPITRDVCINAEGITQLDDAVLFPTDRGIMLIQGSQTQCLTEAIDADEPFPLHTLPHLDEIYTTLHQQSDTCLQPAPFRQFIDGCRMIYDYTHSHIIVFNPKLDDENKQIYPYAYVYSLKSKQWGMTHAELADTVNAYPQALAMTTDNRLVTFSTTPPADDTTPPADDTTTAMFVTRPLKLDTPDALKTISVIIQRGHFPAAGIATLLYASRDLYTWSLVASSRTHILRGFSGTPYKYFRIATIATLKPSQSIFSASIQYTPRYNNKLR